MNRSLAIVVPVLIAAGVVTVFSMTRLQKAQARTVELEEQTASLKKSLADAKERKRC